MKLNNGKTLIYDRNRSEITSLFQNSTICKIKVYKESTLYRKSYLNSYSDFLSFFRKS